MSYQRSLFSQQGKGQSAKLAAEFCPKSGDMMSMDTAKQTLIWQQNQYLIDSGINSEVTSRAPSVCSKDIAPETTGPAQCSEKMPVLQNYVQEPTKTYDELHYAKPTDMRLVGYSAAADENLNSTGLVIDAPSSPPSDSQVLRNVVSNLINYQDESSLLENAIPELNHMLRLDDHVVVGQAAVMIRELAKKETTRLAIINSPQLVASLIRGINGATSFDDVRNMVGTIHILSHYVQGLHVIYRTGVLPTLLRLLSSNVDTLLFYAITVLHNILSTIEESKAKVRAMEGVKKLTLLLFQSDNEKFLAIAVDCIVKLAQGSPESKIAVLANNGTHRLVQIMQVHSYEKLLWLAAKALKMLSCCPENKKAITEAGGMIALANHLTTSSLPLLENCLLTMRNISDIARRYVSGKHVYFILESLVHFMDQAGANVVMCSAGILSNLTCNDASNKDFVCSIGGIETLVKCLFQFADRDIVEPVLCTLRHLTNGHHSAPEAQGAFRRCNGLQVLAKLLQPPSRWSIVKDAVWLVRNLALNPSNQGSMRDCGFVGRLVEIFTRAYQDVTRQPKVCVDGVKMEDLLLSSVATLHVLSRDLENGVILKSSGLEKYLTQLLSHTNKSLQSEAALLLDCINAAAEKSKKNLQVSGNLDGSLGGYISVNHRTDVAIGQKRREHNFQQSAMHHERFSSAQMPTMMDGQNVLRRQESAQNEGDFFVNMSSNSVGMEHFPGDLALELEYDDLFDAPHVYADGNGWLN